MSMLQRLGHSVRFSLLLGALAGLSSAACGDDSSSGTKSAGGSAGQPAASGGAGSGNYSSGGATADQGSAAYCQEWITKCGPDNKLNIVIPVTLKNFSDVAGCKTYYDSSSADCKTCLQLHTDAVHDGSWDHCIHGAGESLDPKCGCVIN